jgi:pimeloyl-ACP methyl ester carboxylesterase
VEGWKIGQRVGVGFLAGNCGYCIPCRSGDLVNCQNQAFTGIHHDGGYAEVMMAKASGLISIPDDLSSEAAAPLLCAGLTTFSALRNSDAKAGDLVAIQGIGGLGHLAVQYVIQDEATMQQSKSGNPMFGTSFPKSGAELKDGAKTNTRAHKFRVGQSEIYAEEKGKGDLSLVFLHYWGGSRRTWSEVIAPLSERFRCIAVDLRGWGKSDHHADDYSLFAQANDVEGLIEELNLTDFMLVGHSMGGKIAQILAGRQLHGLRGVVLVAPAPPTPLHPPDSQKQAMMESYTTPEGIVDALKIVSVRPLTLPQRLQVTEDSLGGALGAKESWVSQGMALDISKEAASIRVPMCVVVGSADPIEKEAALREAILPLVPTARFKTIEGVGHLTPLEGPDEVVNAISDFLAEEKLSDNGKGTK